MTNSNIADENTNYDDIAKDFCKLDVDIQLSLLENWNYPIDLLYSILKYNEYGIVINKIINNFNIDLASPKVEIDLLFKKAREINLRNQNSNKDSNPLSVITIPVNMITKELADKVCSELRSYIARDIIIDASYSTDASLLNEALKKSEKLFIDNYNEIVKAFKKLKSYDSDSPEYDEEKRKLSELLTRLHNEKLLSYLDCSSPIFAMLSSTLDEYIIDYLFEASYFYIDDDLEELLNFCNNGHIDLSDEKVAIYSSLLNITKLDDQEKLALYNRLSKTCFHEEFYDDMKNAILKRNLDIKENCLTKEKMEEFLNPELTQKYGVPIYTPDNNSFIALEKAINPNRPSDDLPTGHSFSIVSSDNPNATYFQKFRYLYDVADLNPVQITHVFPEDSYTKYKPFTETDIASEEKNRLMSTEEILDETLCYNELLILEQGSEKTDIDKSIPKLSKMALYCVDEIGEDDIERAQSEGIGIFLAYSKRKKHEEHHL